MYLLLQATVLLLSSSILSHAKHTDFISHNGLHSPLPSSSEPDVCMTPQCVISAADVLISLDETVDPCDDFYSFACGGWLRRHELGEDQPELHTLVEMENDMNRKLKELLESKHKNSDPPFVKMLKNFYSSCINLDNSEQDGSEPLKKMLSRLGGLPIIEGNSWDESKFDWVDSLISLRKLGYNYNNLMTLTVHRFRKDKFKEGIYMIYLLEPVERLIGGSNLTLGLDDPQISAYFNIMVNATKILGVDESVAEEELLKVLNFTIALEKCTLKQEEENTSNETLIDRITEPAIYTVKELQQKVPQIPWQKYLDGIFNTAINENETLFVISPDFVKKFADLISTTEKRVIANYLMMQAVLESSFYLSEEWDSVYEERKKLIPFDMGEKIVKPRWKRCVSSASKEMAIALSSYYVRHYFNEESKDQAMILVKYIQREFLKILEETDWMDEKTRKKAEEKANAIKSYVGYPEELLNDTFMMKLYENLTISFDGYLENVMVLHKADTDKDLSKLGKTFNLTEKDLEDETKFKYVVKVNAHYRPYENSIVIPAGILHDALYMKDRPNYLNFGAIGIVIGHEITHGFDNRGRLFDKDGQLNMWWDKESDELFRKKVACIIDQYDNYTMGKGMKINGEKTQNENIADNGGLKEAYRAYKSWTMDNGIEPTLPGLNFTQNQLFWLSAANVWCSKYELEHLKVKLLEDNHSPGRYRIIGPMSNLEEFSNDFKCSADSPMNRKFKCEVW